MDAQVPLPRLYVEGKDDVSVVSGLLKRHNVDTDRGSRFLEIKSSDNVEQLLDVMPDAIRSATDRPVGFALDIDIPVGDRWRQVTARIGLLQPRLPKTCPSDGYIGQVEGYPHKFGIWLMPDCRSDGQKIEHLLRTLIPEGDQLWPYAIESTKKAAQIDSRFSSPDKIKAEIHTWLSWQKEPGMPLGAAINSRSFGANSPEALAFLRWLKLLYNLPLKL